MRLLLGFWATQLKEINRMLPQIIYLVLVGIGLLLMSNQHGKPKTGDHNFWISLIAQCIHLGLLYWGGFFNGIF